MCLHNNKTMRYLIAMLGVVFLFSTVPCIAQEELIATAHYSDGTVIPYMLDYLNPQPHYVLILFPGGNGELHLRMKDGKLTYRLKKNFLIRTRKLMVDNEFATVATDSSQSQERIQALLDDIKRRFPAAKIYLMSTSNGTFDSMYLAGYLSTRIAGEIHTSSLEGAGAFDARQYKNRQLFVHHRNDGCRVTPLAPVQSAHEKYGNELIIMDGGQSTGDACHAFAYHGYHGIEKQTIEAIRTWIKKAG